MSVQSHVNSQSLAETFRDLYLAERTGVLELQHGAATKRVFFGRGLIHWAESSESGESLGAALVRRGGLSAGALAEAERNAESTEGLVTALRNRGLIETSVLRSTLRAYLDETVASAFGWASGRASFQPLERVPDLVDVDVLSTFEQILSGVSVMAEFGPIADAMAGLDNKLRRRDPAPVPLERLSLTRTQGYLLARIDGVSSFSDVISTLPPGEDETATRFLFGLLVMGVVEYVPPLGEGPFRVANILRDHADRMAMERMQEKTIKQAYRRMRNQNPHEVLGVTPSASRRAIERAYEEAKGLFSRDRVLPRVRDRLRDELALVEARLIEAYLQLTQPERADQGRADSSQPPPGAVDVQDLLVRPELDKTRTRAAEDEAGRVAELYYGKARQAMRSGDFHNAIQYGKLAISYKNEDARFYFMMADCQVRNPEARWQRLAEENYTRATQLDPWNVDYWISLGRFYKKRGLALRARKQFEEALKLAPGHTVATKELETLG